MVVSGYSMELYCDCEACECYRLQNHAYATTVGFAEFGGETFAECLKNAKRGGWEFADKNSTCYAPGHKSS